MPLNPVPVGDAIATLIQSAAPAPGEAITVGELKTMWEGIVAIIYNDLKANADIIPGTLNNPSGQPIAVSTGPGAGSTGATSSPEPIVGIGKIT